MIYIVRHGQTEMNHRKVLQGRSDDPLDEIGFAQAQAAAEKLMGIRFDRVYTSPLKRAIQTARIIAPYVDPEIVRTLYYWGSSPELHANFDRINVHFFALKLRFFS